MDVSSSARTSPRQPHRAPPSPSWPGACIRGAGAAAARRGSGDICATNLATTAPSPAARDRRDTQDSSTVATRARGALGAWDRWGWGVRMHCPGPTRPIWRRMRGQGLLPSTRHRQRRQLGRTGLLAAGARPTPAHVRLHLAPSPGHSASRMRLALVARSSLGSSDSPGSPCSCHPRKTCALPCSEGEAEAPGCAGPEQGHGGTARESWAWRRGCLHRASPTHQTTAPSILGAPLFLKAPRALRCCWGVSSSRSPPLSPSLPCLHSPGPWGWLRARCPLWHHPHFPALRAVVNNAKPRGFLAATHGMLLLSPAGARGETPGRDPVGCSECVFTVSEGEAVNSLGLIESRCCGFGLIRLPPPPPPLDNVSLKPLCKLTAFLRAERWGSWRDTAAMALRALRGHFAVTSSAPPALLLAGKGCYSHELTHS